MCCTNCPFSLKDFTNATGSPGKSLGLGTWESPQECAQLCASMGYHAEVLFVALNWFLVAARARPQADAEEARKRDFEAWRDAKLTLLDERLRRKK